MSETVGLKSLKRLHLLNHTIPHVHAQTLTQYLHRDARQPPRSLCCCTFIGPDIIIGSFRNPGFYNVPKELIANALTAETLRSKESHFSDPQVLIQNAGATLSCLISRRPSNIFLRLSPHAHLGTGILEQGAIKYLVPHPLVVLYVEDLGEADLPGWIAR